MLLQLVRILRECTCPRDLKLVYGAAIKSNAPGEDSFFANQFIAACTRLRQIDYALSIFSRVREPNAFVYNALIRGLHLCSSPMDALELYSAMGREGKRPTGYTFTSVFKACEQVPPPAAAEFAGAVQAQAWKLGYGADVFVQTSLLDLYSNTGRIADSKRVFDEMVERDGVSWTAMISAHAESGDMESARRVFEEMPERGTVAWNTMIAGYARTGEVESAASLFGNMPIKDLVSWTTMISCYAHNKFFMAAIQTFKEMETSGFVPDAVTMASVISACAHLGALELGRGAHLRALQRGGFCAMDVFVGSALIDMYAKCGSLESSLLVFFKLRTRNLFCWNAAIDGLAAHGRGTAALRLFSLLEHQPNAVPNSVTFVSVLSACSHAGLVEQGRRVFSTMVARYSIPPAVEHYGCMVDLLSRGGLLDEAMSLVQSMAVPPNAAVWGALLGGCKTHGDREIGAAAASRLISLQPGDSGHYSLSVNLYAQAKDWPKVAAIRALMKGRFVQKSSPGSSWIEIGESVHEFTAAGGSHGGNAILFLLTHLDRHLKQEEDVDISWVKG